MTTSTDKSAHASVALAKTAFMTYWLDGADKPEAEPHLQKDISCDLLIVGAGFCGLWAALIAKEANPKRKIILIEGKKIANGATGRPAAILSASVMHGIVNTERMFPTEVATLEKLGVENMEGFADTIAKYDIDCDLEWGGELTVAVSEEEIPTLEHEHSLFEKYGHAPQMLSRDEVRAEVDSPMFHGGLLVKKHSGTVHPGKLAWGLKRAVLELGVQVYENTPLLKSKKSRAGVIVSTPEGMITAKKVLLCTNAYAAGHRKIKNRVVAIRDRIVVTQPLTDDQLNRIGWKSRCGIYDTRTQLNYMRLTADNRVLFGGRLGYYFGGDTDPQADKKAQPYVRLVENLYETFPQLGGITIDYAWSGPIGLTTRMAVHYQSYHGGDMVFAGGYSGFGVTSTRFGARVGLDILDDIKTPERDLSFAKTKPAYVPPEPLRWIGFKITTHALDTADEKGGWRRPWIKMVEKMGFPIVLH